MTDLLAQTLAAHGGLDRWRKLISFTAHLKGGGALFSRKGFPDAFKDVQVQGRCHEQEARHFPFLGPEQRTVVRLGYAAIKSEDGKVLQERRNPADAMRTDRHAQGHGYGKEALRLVAQWIERTDLPLRMSWQASM
ncbi:hypothetical protein ACFOEZ_10425 [Tianweitania populi]|uniref:Uncharacterized protein n=1 Tax=Tianweitania populi TaxID=1607949 RepID=A0A8J3DSE4_9HYPH|nr:hypothetical protein [Tianweitania populi]GHD20753.1 hypothetical protein GCM10016234_33350 [Tianweitania populi]